MNPSPPNPENPPPPADATDPVTRLAELQADRAVQGLTQSQEADLQSLLGREDLRDDESLDHAAAAAALAMSADAEPVAMPAPIRERLLRAGEAWASQTRTGTVSQGLRLADPDADSQYIERKLHPTGRPAQPGFGRMVATWGGWLAAAACLTITAMYTTRSPQQVVPPPFQQIADLSPVTGFDDLAKRHDSGEHVLTVSATLDDGVEADLQFDPEKNEGYLAIAGLDVNDESDRQYQMWFLDAGRDHPVDGGTFDVRSVQRGAKIVVPVSTRIPVRAPIGFAVSVEPRGGVVLPKADRIIFRADMPQIGPPAPRTAASDRPPDDPDTTSVR